VCCRMTPAMWDRRYSRRGFAYGAEPNDFLRQQAPKQIPTSAGSRVLCLGEGEGRNAVFLASLGHACTCVDFSRTGLAKARALGVEHSVRLRTVAADLANYDPGPEGSWDAVVSIFCQPEPSTRIRMHAACARALRPGGVFLLEGFTPRQLLFRTGGPSEPERLFTAAMLAKDFASFDVILSRDVEREVIEGSYHTGLSAVTQLVARKPLVPAAIPIEIPAAATAAAGAREASMYGQVAGDLDTNPGVLEAAASAELASAACCFDDTQRRYRERIDEIFSDAGLVGEAGIKPDMIVELADGQDRLLANASQSIRLSAAAATQAGRCRYCWVPRTSCFCDSLPQDLLRGHCRPSALQWVLLCHPQEFLRSTSSGKLVAQVLGGDFIVYGAACESQRKRLEEVLTDDRTVILFPGEGSASVSDVAAASVARTGGETQASEGDGNPSVIVLVPDGTWEQVRAIHRELVVRWPSIRRMHLQDKAIHNHDSPLINTLRPGVGRGRVTTFEACALLLEEAGATGVWGVSPQAGKLALGAMEPLVRAVAADRRAMAQAITGPTEELSVAARRSRRRRRGCNAELERWVSALKEIARKAPLNSAAAARCCCVCGAALSTPLRMRSHLEGRRHCLAVAERHLLGHGQSIDPCSSDDPVNITAAVAETVFHQHSTLPMSLCTACDEPPDAALVVIRGGA